MICDEKKKYPKRRDLFSGGSPAAPTYLCIPEQMSMRRKDRRRRIDLEEREKMNTNNETLIYFFDV